jgi:hypothetical protein
VNLASRPRVRQFVKGGPPGLSTWIPVPGDPNGSLRAAAGTVAVKLDGSQAWINVDGQTTWLLVAASGGSFVPKIVVNDDPSWNVTAAAGTVAVKSDNSQAWYNVDGGVRWAELDTRIKWTCDTLANIIDDFYRMRRWTDEGEWPLIIIRVGQPSLASDNESWEFTYVSGSVVVEVKRTNSYVPTPGALTLDISDLSDGDGVPDIIQGRFKDLVESSSSLRMSIAWGGDPNVAGYVLTDRHWPLDTKCFQNFLNIGNWGCLPNWSDGLFPLEQSQTRLSKVLYDADWQDGSTPHVVLHGLDPDKSYTFELYLDGGWGPGFDITVQPDGLPAQCQQTFHTYSVDESISEYLNFSADQGLLLGRRLGSPPPTPDTLTSGQLNVTFYDASDGYLGTKRIYWNTVVKTDADAQGKGGLAHATITLNSIDLSSLIGQTVAKVALQNPDGSPYQWLSSIALNQASSSHQVCHLRGGVSTDLGTIDLVGPNSVLTTGLAITVAEGDLLTLTFTYVSADPVMGTQVRSRGRLGPSLLWSNSLWRCDHAVLDPSAAPNLRDVTGATAANYKSLHVVASGPCEGGHLRVIEEPS